MFINDDYSAVVMNYTDPYYDISYAHSRPVKYIAPVTSMLEDQLQDPGFEAASLLFEDRLRQHGNRVQLLNTQLAERDQIGHEHIDEINKAAMKCSGYLELTNLVQQAGCPTALAVATYNLKAVSKLSYPAQFLPPPQTLPY